MSIVANWSGKGKRGLIMGIWNAHTSVGNILGTMIAAGMLSQVGVPYPTWKWVIASDCSVMYSVSNAYLYVLSASEVWICA